MEGVESSVEQGSKKCKHFLPIKAKKTNKQKKNPYKTNTKQKANNNNKLTKKG